MAAELVDMIGIEKAEKYNTSLCLNFFSEKVINWWMENSTVSATSVNSFKSHLQRMWIIEELLLGLQVIDL